MPSYTKSSQPHPNESVESEPARNVCSGEEGEADTGTKTDVIDPVLAESGKGSQSKCKCYIIQTE